MLVLSQKENGQIMIGDEITITITRIGKQNVRVGIDAPKHIQILRRELFEKKQAEQAATDSDCD